MPDNLLSTKLFIPSARPNLVQRLRLVERLNTGLHRQLTLVSAPAGFGKTTLISNWIRTLEFPRGWLSLDEAANDIYSFLQYFVAALSNAYVQGSDNWSDLSNQLQSRQPLNVESLFTIIINALVDMPEKCILVLDDFHLVDEQNVHDALNFLIENAPPQLHIVISTREDPNLPLAKFRARDQMNELRASDLRFTTSEAAEFLNQVMGLDLSAEDVAALEVHTEGWIAGLQMAAISMRGSKDIANFIRSFTGSHRFVMDYLIEEVLKQQSENVQNFLMQTSILDRMTGDLCNAVTDLTNSQEILEMLEQANLFIVPLDNERRWYRYHHLFADLLYLRLNQTFPEVMTELHLKASKWFNRNKFTDEAIEHALRAEDLDRVADLTELAWRELNLGYRSAAWLGWVRTLPEELIRSRPMLSTGFAWALIDNGDLDGADQRFRDAERWLEAQTDPADLSDYLSFKKIVLDSEELRSLSAWIANGRAYLTQAHGDFTGTIKYAQQALELLPEDNYFERGLSAVLPGFAYWANGDLDLAYKSVAEAIGNMEMLGNTTFIISFSSYLNDILIAQGRLHEAETNFIELLELAAEQGDPNMPVTAVAHLGLSEIAYERGDIQAARRHLMRSNEMGELPTLPPWYRHWVLATTRIKSQDGDLSGVIKILGDAERFYYKHPIPDIRPLKALQARAWLAAGELSSALDCVNEAGISCEDELTYLQEFEHITLARILIERGRLENEERPLLEAIDLLERLELAAEEGQRTKSAIEILMLLSLASGALGKLPAALKSLERSVQMAEPEGFVQLFVDEGSTLEELLNRISSDDFRINSYLPKLLAYFDRDSESTVSSDQPLIDPLSEREIEVLGLIAEGLTNQEIGNRLYLSLNTVKVHTRNIYSKLGVNNRTQAVAQARTFRILTSD